MGPTASGKTGLAETLAQHLGARLINADAFQVYRGLDIGTAKPSDKNAYDLLDIKDPNEPFGVGEWTRMAQSILEEIYHRGQHALVVGGTGLYVRALFEEYASMADEPDPELRARLNLADIEDLRLQLRRDHPEIADRTDMANPVRVRRAIERLQTAPMNPIRLPPFKKLKLGVDPPMEVLHARIERRTSEMVHNGWIQEIERLSREGFRRDDPGFRAIGYQALWDHLERKISLDEAIATTIAETRRYAKRQRTWLRSEPGLVELSTTTEENAVRKAMERIDNVLK